MDPLARLWQTLTRSRQAWQQAPDPVRRMALLRELFREVHRLYNEVLVGHAASSLDEFRAIHASLEHIPGALEHLDSNELKSLLSKTTDLPDLLRGLKLEAGSDVAPSQEHAEPFSAKSSPREAVPAFLDRPDRSWERLIWRAATSSTDWQLESKIATLSLREFGVLAQDRERELSQDGIVLAVSCLTSSGDIREWQWHYLSPKGDQP